jgi:hypothetical protein
MNLSITTRLAGGLAAAFGLFALAPEASAQQLMGLDGPSATVRSFNGGNNDDCMCPGLWPGGHVDQFDYYQFFNPCSAPKPFSDLAMTGGVAHDSRSGNTYVTDGDTIACYGPMPEYKIRCHFPRPEGMGMLTGLGWCSSPSATAEDQPTGGTLYVTDGFRWAEIALPPCMMGCGETPYIINGPHDLPWEWAGLATGITYDPKKRVLFFCTSTGNVFSRNLNNSSNIFQDWSVANPSLYAYCPMSFMLTGITADRAYYGTGTVFVTDGEKYIRTNWGGYPANNDMTPAFSWYCDWCYYVPEGYGNSDHPISGLAYNGKCNTYGYSEQPLLVEDSVQNGNGAHPTISANSESWMGNHEFELQLDHAIPGSIALLLFGLDHKCPLPPQDIPIMVETLYIVDLQMVDSYGELSFPLPLPPDPLDATGLHAYFQWILIDLWGGTDATKGLACQLMCL